jgi:putative endonuclease
VTAGSFPSTRRRADVASNAGARAEAQARAFLEARGLRVIAQNFRTRRGEIDLIAQDGETLVFVEVRQRRSAAFGGAAASITSAKRARVIAAAQAYLATLSSEPACRFDAILIDGATSTCIDWRRDAFSAE